MTLIEMEIAKKVKEFGSILYHYTSIEALYGILKNQEIWACSSTAVNDKKESRYFVEELSKALKRDLIGETLDRCTSFFEELERRLETEMPYIMCFSGEADDASQWERYADSAKGVCISFDTANLLRSWNLSTNKLNPTKVVYGCKPETHEHYKYLKEYFETGNIPVGYLSNKKGMMDNILVCSYGIKHPSFKAEHEIRFTTLWNKGIRDAKREYVVKRGQICNIWKVPLVTTVESLDVHIDIEDIIKVITIGPRSEQSVDNLKDYIENGLGLKKLSQHICASECPLR